MLISQVAGGQAIKEDKLAHATVGFLIGVPAYYFYYDTVNIQNPYWSIAATTGSAAFFGWVLEEYQRNNNRGVYDNGDILAGAVGAFTGAIFAEIIRHKPERYKERQLRKQKRREERYRNKMK